MVEIYSNNKYTDIYYFKFEDKTVYIDDSRNIRVYEENKKCIKTI